MMKCIYFFFKVYTRTYTHKYVGGVDCRHEVYIYIYRYMYVFM